MIIGFDVGGTNARGLLVDPDSGEVIDRDSTRSDGEGADLVNTLVTMTRRLAERNSTDVEAIGVGIAGLAATSGILHYSPNLPRLLEFPIGPDLEVALGLPVTIANDANAGAWAEAKLGAGRGVDNLAYVSLGTGIGTGFVIGGQLLLGANGFAGEAGHMVVNFDGDAHITGQRGPWEYYASGSALGRIGREAAADGRFPRGIALAGTVEAITGYHVATAMFSGDNTAIALFDRFCRDVALGVANLVMVLDPRRVILGGGLSEIGGPLRAGVDRWLQHEMLGGQHRPTVEIVLAELGSEAGAIGAALLTQIPR